jgi:hypothetical protein
MNFPRRLFPILFMLGSCQPMLFCQDAPAASAPVQASTGELRVPGAYHITGIVGVPRDAKGELVFSSQAVRFERKKRPVLEIPYQRMHRVQLLRGERDYALATYALAVSVGAPGALLMFKHRKVDALIFEYENERGGLMAVLLQLPKGEGERSRVWLNRLGMLVEEPPTSPPKNK